jgi:hypothetical protein
MKTTSLLLALCLPTALTAQTPAAPAAPAQLVLEPGATKFRDLVDRAAAVMGANILLHEQELAGSRSESVLVLQQRLVASAAECEATLSTLLVSQGLALTVLDGPRRLYEVVSMHGPRNRLERATLRTAEDLLAAPTSRMPVTTMVTLKHTNATIITNMLRPFFASTGAPGGGQITIGTAGPMTLVVTGMQDQVVGVLRMVREGDQAGTEPPLETAERLEQLERRIAALEARLDKK